MRTTQLTKTVCVWNWSFFHSPTQSVKKGGNFKHGKVFLKKVESFLCWLYQGTLACDPLWINWNSTSYIVVLFGWRYREPETNQNARPFGSSMAERQRFGCLDTCPWNCKQTPSLRFPIRWAMSLSIVPWYFRATFFPGYNSKKDYHELAKLWWYFLNYKWFRKEVAINCRLFIIS